MHGICIVLRSISCSMSRLKPPKCMKQAGSSLHEHHEWPKCGWPNVWIGIPWWSMMRPLFWEELVNGLSLILLIYPARNCQIFGCCLFWQWGTFRTTSATCTGMGVVRQCCCKATEVCLVLEGNREGPQSMGDLEMMEGTQGWDSRFASHRFSSVFITIQDGRWSHCSCIPWPWTGCQPIPASLHRIYIRNTQDCPRVIRVKQSTENKANVANPLLKPIKLLTTCWIWQNFKCLLNLLELLSCFFGTIDVPALWPGA